MKTFPYSKAVEGYTLSLGARNLSPDTMIDYGRTLDMFGKFIERDLLVDDITPQHIELFLKSRNHLSNKSLLNYYIGLSAFWSWLLKNEIVKTNIVKKLTPPKPEIKEIVPLKEEELKAIMASLNRSKVYKRGSTTIDHALGSFERNRAIILLMLDTGIRASELCDLKLEDLDSRNNRVYVRHGKGAKERTLPFSPRTGQMIWRYVASRENTRPEDPLFVSRLNRRITRTKLSETISSIGKRAGVANVHPHRFRHTFAIQYLRNGGNAYTLQSMLGHASLDMVKHYLQIAQTDLDAAHRRASPVDNWRL